LDDQVKCCSTCLLYEHKTHEFLSISEAIKKFKSKISEMDFKTIYSNLEIEMKEFDKQITSKQKELLKIQEKMQKELLDLQIKKQQKVDLLESIQKIYNTFKREEDIDRIIEWGLYLGKKVGINELWK
jgi:hypothetical protein